MIYLQLFWSFLQIGLFSFGGGYAAMPLIQNQVVAVHGWLTQREFTDLVTISQMTPGPIAINSATFVGSKIAGTGGSLAATIGCILPSCVIVMLIAWLYRKYSNLHVIDNALRGLRPAVVGMIGSAAFSMIQSSFLAATGTAIMGVDVAAVIIFAGAFLALRKWKPSPIFVMCACGLAGFIVYSIFGGV